MQERFKYSSILLGVTCLLLCAFAAQALEIPAPTGYRVNDFASLLSPEAKSRLESKLRTFEKETTTQIVVTTFPSLEDESLEDFTNRLFEAWKIGQKNNNNGVLLSIFVKERKVRIEVGYGLEGVLTDALSSRIIRNELVPEFRAGNPEQGIEKAVDAIQKAVRGEYTAKEPKPNATSYVALLVFFLVILYIIIKISQQPMTIGPYSRRRRNDSWGGGWYGGSGGGWGGGSGGGFSGGGGMSGGGGASGSW